eukprot:GEMP01074574.1.p1 GENE.GEMP01074574.1~~GEMP01074574.1.p1  ORF type:complete len:106 (+),score=7.74 GEMP01074574.1:90-407(+)
MIRGFLVVVTGLALRHQGDSNSQQGDVFHEGCRPSCDSCFADHTMYCYAQCYKGCQQYCKEVDTLPGCSEREMWSATPGSPPEFVPRYRICNSDDLDGCPSAYLY